jgi:hypothetical protein
VNTYAPLLTEREAGFCYYCQILTLPKLHVDERSKVSNPIISMVLYSHIPGCARAVIFYSDHRLASLLDWQAMSCFYIQQFSMSNQK